MIDVCLPRCIDIKRNLKDKKHEEIYFFILPVIRYEYLG